MRLAAFEPDIPQNLGAMIRIGACFGVPVDVIGPAGFPFSVKALRRSAMDYADVADVHHHVSWDAFLQTVSPARLLLLSTKGEIAVWDHRFMSGDVLIMGRESAGAPEHVHTRADAVLTIPMPGGARSLNVAVAAGIAVAEATRQGQRPGV